MLGMTDLLSDMLTLGAKVVVVKLARSGVAILLSVTGTLGAKVLVDRFAVEGVTN